MDFFIRNRIFVASFFILLLLNYIAVYAGPNSYAFLLRIVDASLFLFLFLHFNKEKKSRLILLLYIFFLIPEVLALCNTLMLLYALYVARIIRQILFIAFVFGLTDFQKVTRKKILLITAVSLLNISLVFYVMELIENNLFTDFQFNLLMIESALMLIMGFLAAIYWYSKRSIKSKRIVFAIFMFILSDIFFAIAFYGQVTPLFYLDITLYLCGFVFLTLGVLNTSKKLVKVKKVELDKPFN